MLQQMDNLENIIERVSVTIQSLKNEKEQIVEELEIVREVLDEKEKEMAAYLEEKALMEQRLTDLLGRVRSAFDLQDGPSSGDVGSPDEPGLEDPEGHDPEDIRGEQGVRQGELTDRF